MKAKFFIRAMHLYLRCLRQCAIPVPGEIQYPGYATVSNTSVVVCLLW